MTYCTGYIRIEIDSALEKTNPRRNSCALPFINLNVLVNFEVKFWRYLKKKIEKKGRTGQHWSCWYSAAGNAGPSHGGPSLRARFPKGLLWRAGLKMEAFIVSRRGTHDILAGHIQANRQAYIVLSWMLSSNPLLIVCCSRTNPRHKNVPDSIPVISLIKKGTFIGELASRW